MNYLENINDLNIYLSAYKWSINGIDCKLCCVLIVSSRVKHSGKSCGFPDENKVASKWNQSKRQRLVRLRPFQPITVRQCLVARQRCGQLGSVLVSVQQWAVWLRSCCSRAAPRHRRPANENTRLNVGFCLFFPTLRFLCSFVRRQASSPLPRDRGRSKCPASPWAATAPPGRGVRDPVKKEPRSDEVREQEASATH